ncbi:rod-binding protein [Sphingomonas sp. MMSM20]|uniref:rod-binding protein n=1 Tax=Sphingomonas lycopersici TaxID=2951807 RepID=UPI00223861BB|nr:rod-binding protein [Sphingomonas lycopersici]MCW6531384.1 rod-binding protein [Sphingomonas lycopersici]
MTADVAGSVAKMQITGATGLDTGLSRAASKENLAKAGKQFETVFTGMMLKSMRQAKLADPLFDSKALDTFRDMQDQKFVQAMADHAPLGIGRAMTDFLARSQPALNTEPAKSD